MSYDLSLEPILQQVEPRVRLVPERAMRQLLDFLRDSARALPLNPNLPFWISCRDLTLADIWSLRSLRCSDPGLLLITNPNDRLLSHRPKEEQLLEYWQLLFQAAIIRELDRKVGEGLLTNAMCLERLSRYGLPAEREIRFVCLSENLVVEDADAIALYRSFAALYLKLLEFEPSRLADFFPSLTDRKAVEEMFRAELDFSTLLKTSRPPGSANPHQEVAPDVSWLTPDLASAPLTASPPAETGGLRQLAQEAEKRGNFIRAAILDIQLANCAVEEDKERYRFDAVINLNKVVVAVGDLFEWDDDTRQEWRQALIPLLEPAATGVWPRAARCLYELQRIPAELSREVYAVDLPEYIRTFGRRPIKRPLPHARPVLLLMHLKKAHAQMVQAGLSHAVHLRLDRLFNHRENILENTIREEFTPIFLQALTRAGLIPLTTVETVGRDKLVAELLDRICERGFLRLGDLRDAIARNRLKMPDLQTLGDFFRGDGLLRTDLELTYALDGVYRKGEVYLRLLQRFSALFFGTRVGRLITIYLAIPFGGAFLALMFAHEIHSLGGRSVITA